MSILLEISKRAEVNPVLVLNRPYRAEVREPAGSRIPRSTVSKSKLSLVRRLVAHSH